MKRFFSMVIGLFIIYFSYGLLLSRYSFNIIPEELEPADPKGFYDYQGVTNLRWRAEDGELAFSEVISAAQEAGLDFLFLTTLSTSSVSNDWEGYHNKVLVFIDNEYSLLDARLLNYDATDNPALRGPGRSQVLFAELLSRQEREASKGIFILAHPFKPGYQWSGPFPEGLDGIEVISLSSIWQKNWLEHKATFFWTLLVYPFNQELAFIRLFEVPKSEINLWDQLTRSRPTVGVAGIDADSKPRGTYLTIPSHETLFSIVRNHILLQSELTGNASSDRRKIAEALRRGQFYMSLDIMANPKGFLAMVKNAKGEIFPLGSRLEFSPEQNLEIEITLPQKPSVPFEIILYRNGERIASGDKKTLLHKITEPGVYRAIVRVIPTLPLPDGRKWIPWIFTNPFYISPSPSKG